MVTYVLALGGHYKSGFKGSTEGINTSRRRCNTSLLRGCPLTPPCFYLAGGNLSLSNTGVEMLIMTTKEMTLLPVMPSLREAL